MTQAATTHQALHDDLTGLYRSRGRVDMDRVGRAHRRQEA